jgi:drug/metabolite transporter (DMT)-like permease
MIGIVFGLTGIVTLIGWGLLQGLNVNILAQLAVVGAAISYAFAGIYGKRLKEIPPIIAAASQVTATTIMMLPVALLVDRPWQQATPGFGTILSVIALGLLSTALAYIIYFRLLATAGATNLLLVTFLIPVSAVFLGVTFLKEAIDLRQITGMLLIGMGLAYVDGRLPRRIKQVFQRSVI